MTIEPVAEGVPLSDQPSTPPAERAAAAEAEPVKTAKSGPARTPRTADPKPKPKPKAAKTTKTVREPAAEFPYAQVVLAAETGVDQVVDYLVPVELDEQAHTGARVRVRWDGQLVDGVVIARSPDSSFHDHFEWLQKIASPVPALTPEIAELAGTVAEKYAGTLVDVLRLAIPARSASAEKAAPETPDIPSKRWINGSPWATYGGGREFINALERKDGDRLPRALWTCLPGADWATAVATAMHAVASDVTYLPMPDTPQEPDTTPTRTDAGYGADPAADPETGTLVGYDPDYDPDLYPEGGFDPDFDPDLYYLDPDIDVAPEAAVAALAEAMPGHGHGHGHSHGPGSGTGTTSGPSPTEPEPVHAPGRGTLAIVPDPRALARLDRALTEVAGPGHHVVLSEELSAAKRYQNWLAVLRGEVRMVIGTRAALFAPVADLGFVAMWDDGDDRHAEPRAPYPHVREVLLLRAHQTGAGALIGGYTCTAEGAQLVSSRWAFPLTAFRTTVRAKAPRVEAADPDLDEERDAGAVAARLPNLAWRTARAALTSGPVLVQVPQGADIPTLVCVRCHKNARCTFCHGPLAPQPAGGGSNSSGTGTGTGAPGSSHPPTPSCLWCGRPPAGGWRCDGSRFDRPCDGDHFRLAPPDAARTADGLAEAFPHLLVVSSTPASPVDAVGAKPALVVAAPGTEPVAEGGYAAALLLDGRTLLSRPDFRADAEALRHWLNAAALVRPAEEGGTVVVVADPGQASVHALAQWDPVTHARRELAARSRAHHPPVARIAELVGTPRALAEELKLLGMPAGVEVLGPVPFDAFGEHSRVLIRVPRNLGPGLVTALRRVQDRPGARKDADRVRVRIDPVRIG